MPIEKYGKTFFPNSDVSGVSIEFYHIGKGSNPKGGRHAFGIRTVLPPIMVDGVDWERCKTDEEYRKSFASDSLMLHVDAMEKSLAMHPDCIEVTDFFGRTHDVSEVGLDTMIEGMLREVAQNQYDEEKARGIVPKGMSFEEWTEVASPEAGSLGDWNPTGKAN